ncbi:hypothetical protein PMAYCL1PPCAC_08336, partial [Pristionchus mayeri]
ETNPVEVESRPLETKVSSTTSAGVEELPLFDLDDTDEIKEEPEEMKDEPICELAGFKQENHIEDNEMEGLKKNLKISTNFKSIFKREKIAARNLASAPIYFPSTGNSRIINHELKKSNSRTGSDREKISEMNLPPPQSGMCDFCDDPAPPCRPSPKDQTSAQRFFATIMCGLAVKLSLSNILSSITNAP